MINESFYFWHPATTGEQLRITTSSDDSAILSSPQSSLRSTPPLSSVLFTPNLQSSLGSTPPKTEWDRVQLSRGTKMPVYNEEDFYILTQIFALPSSERPSDKILETTKREDSPDKCSLAGVHVERNYSLEGSVIVMISGQTNDDVRSARTLILRQNQKERSKSEVDIMSTTSSPDKKEKFLILSIEVTKDLHQYLFGCDFYGLTGVMVDFPDLDTDSATVVLSGQYKYLQSAIQLMHVQITEHFKTSINCPFRFHRSIIGYKGYNIVQVITTYPRLNVELSWERNSIELEGPKSQVELAKRHFQTVVDNLISSEKAYRWFAEQARIPNQESDIIFISSSPMNMTNNQNTSYKTQTTENETNEDITSLELAVPKKFNREILGERGRNVSFLTELSTRHQVAIRFKTRSLVSSSSSRSSELNSSRTSSSVATDDTSQDTREDYIKITGRREQCEAAKSELMDLLPVTVELTVSQSLHRFIIGQQGQDIRRIMSDYHVQVWVPPPMSGSDVVKITGTPQHVEEAKKAILDQIQRQKDEKLKKPNQAVHIQMHVDPRFHARLIGRNGVAIQKLSQDLGVSISFGRPDLVTITGSEEKTKTAKEELTKIISDLASVVKAEFDIDHAFHSRLIGIKGKVVQKMMHDFGVDIKFADRHAVNPDLVTITGHADKVAECKAYILKAVEQHRLECQNQRNASSSTPSVANPSNCIRPFTNQFDLSSSSAPPTELPRFTVATYPLPVQTRESSLLQAAYRRSLGIGNAP